MDTIPNRNKLALATRKVSGKIEESLVLPIKHPSFYQISALILSILLLFIENKPLIAAIVTIIILTDWFDGAVARKYKLTGKEGWLIDVVVDRISEGFIFSAILPALTGKIFFASYIVNIGLSFYSVRSGKHTLLPLRFIYLLYVLYLILF